MILNKQVYNLIQYLWPNPVEVVLCDCLYHGHTCLLPHGVRDKLPIGNHVDLPSHLMMVKSPPIWRLTELHLMQL